MISAAQLKIIAPHAKDPEGAAENLSAAACKYAITPGLRFNHWLAQLLEETQGLTHFEENLNYSAENLMKVWPSRFGPATAQIYAHQPEKIANKVYANRMGNGDEASGDGWKYRGRGCLMVTGRANYASAARLTGADFIGHPELMGGDTLGAVAYEEAGEFWSIHGCNALADADDITSITRTINGGLTGLASRKTWYANVLAVLTPPTVAAPPEPVMSDASDPGPSQPSPAAPAPAPVLPSPETLYLTSLVRMGLGALAAYLLDHKLMPPGTSTADFVNQGVPFVLWAGGTVWIVLKNFKQVRTMVAFWKAPPPPHIPNP